MKSVPWTEKEDEILRQYYSTEGYKLLVLLPNRSRNAIHYRARKLGLKEPVPVPWNPNEDSV